MVPRAGKGSALSELWGKLLCFLDHTTLYTYDIRCISVGERCCGMNEKFQWDDHKEKSKGSGARQKKKNLSKKVSYTIEK